MRNEEIHQRLDLLVDKMRGRTLKCKSWHGPSDQMFEPPQVRGTFDFILDGFDKKHTNADVMRWANDLWREACKRPTRNFNAGLNCWRIRWVV